MTTFSLVSQKGGVGKSTIGVNLSYSLARRGWRVLLVDADPQGGVGFSITEKAKDATGYFDFLTDEWTWEESELLSTIIATNLPGLGLLTRGTRDALDRLLSVSKEQLNLEERIDTLDGLLRGLDYDLIIYDTPSGVSEITMGIAGLCDWLLAPQRPEPLCLRSMPQILRMIAAAKSGSESGSGPRLGGFILSIADPEDPSNLEDQKEFRDLLPVELVFETVIPEHRDFREASRAGVPVAMLRERPSPSSLIFDQLAAELETAVGLFEDTVNPAEDPNDYARLVD